MPLAAPELVGCEVPRLWTPPLRELTPETTRGFEAIDFAEHVLRVPLMPWQRWLFLHALETTESGAFRFRTVVVLVARQNGKSTWMQALALWRMYLDKAGLVIGTAQNLDVAEEAWAGAVDMAEGVPDLAAEIASVDRTNGKKALRLQSGERYKVAAASRRGGRGLSGDLVVLDELREHQTWDAWGAVTKTTMARTRPQIVCLSNAGDIHSVVLNHLHDLGLKTVEGDGDESLGLFEWSAPDDCDLDDRAAWAQANPALGWTIQPDSIAAARATDPEPVFRTEVLCQRVLKLADAVIPAQAWDDCRDERSQPSDPVVFAVDVTPDRARACVAVAGMSGDRLHVEVVEHQSGTEWVTKRVADLVARWRPDAVLLDPAGAAGSLIPALQAERVDLTLVRTGDIGRACGAFYDAVVQGRVRHRGQMPLDDAVAGATRRPLGRDAWAWNRQSIDVDICPLVAVTLAAWGLQQQASAVAEPSVFVL